jgi:hypothetical protein
MMADNLAYVIERERGRGKVLAFAHNSHLQRGPARWQLGPNLLEWWPAGAHLNEMLGSEYAVIGTGVGEMASQGIGAPEAGTLEARLMAGGGDGALIATHRGEGLAPAEIAVRSGSATNSAYFPLGAQSLRDFDWLAVISG